MPFSGDAVHHEIRWRSQETLPAPAHIGEYRKLVLVVDQGEIFGFVAE